MTGAFSLAVHALVYLNRKQATLSSEALAENICTNPARVRKVMAMLKRARLVVTKEGADGGYTFTGDADAVTLRQVAEAVEARFVAAPWRSGRDNMDCLIASGMAQVMDGIYERLNRQCMERLTHITVADIDRLIFDEPESPGAKNP